MMSLRTDGTSSNGLQNTPATVTILSVVGDLWFVAAIVNGTASSVTDNRGGTYVEIASRACATGTLYVWVRTTLSETAISTAFTVTPSGDGIQMWAGALAGSKRAGLTAIRQFITSAGGAGVSAATFAEQTMLQNFLFAFIGDGSSPAGVTAPSGFTLRYNTATNCYVPPPPPVFTPVIIGFGLAVLTGGTENTVTWGTNPTTSWANVFIEVDNQLDLVYQDLDLAGAGLVQSGATVIGSIAGYIADPVAPTMTVVSPDAGETPGSSGAFPADFDSATTTAIVFDLDDNIELAYASVFHTQSNGSRKCVYRRGAFEVGYRSSSQETIGATLRLHVRLDGGWPAGQVELVADLVDADGNLSVVS